MGRGNVNRMNLNYNKGVKATLVFFFWSFIALLNHVSHQLLLLYNPLSTQQPE